LSKNKSRLIKCAKGRDVEIRKGDITAYQKPMLNACKSTKSKVFALFLDYA
jgi:hypothetical protein